MVIDINDSYEDIIKQLSSVEKNILFECGKMNISIKKNINEETIKKKLSKKDLKNYRKAQKNLINSGLMVKYRSKNYGLSQKGRIVANIIVKDRNKKFYKDLTILMNLLN